MSAQRRRSKATRWAGARTPNQAFRDREWVTLPNGERKRIAGYGPTRQAATKNLHASIEQEVARHRQGGAATMNSVMARLIWYKRTVKGTKNKTRYNDLKLYRLHIGPFIGRKRIVDVTLEDLQAIQARLTGEKKYRTAELATILLRSLYRHAVRVFRAEIRAGLPLFNLAEDLERIKRPTPSGDDRQRSTGVPWTEAQVRKFLEAARVRYEKSQKHLLYPYFHTAIAAGLRRGELLGLRRRALQSRTITVDGEEVTSYFLRVDEQLVYYDGKHHRDTPKSAASVRDVPIGPELVEVLEVHMRKVDRVRRENPQFIRSCDLMFPSYNGRPLEPRNIYRAWKQLIDELELPEAVPHDLRGIYSTFIIRELVRQGTWSPKILQALLGHSTPDVGLRHYARVIEADFVGAVFDPLWGRIPEVGVNSGVNQEKEKDALSKENAS